MFASDVTKWENNVEIFDYVEASDPSIKPMPVFVHPHELHQNGLTRVIPFEKNGSWVFLLDNKACKQKKILTHVMWCLLNSIPPNTIQKTT